MTKDEIKKALECWVSTEYVKCKQCPNYDLKHEDCVDNLKRQELALITEQEKEIEQLKTEIIKQDQAIIERNFELVDLEDKIKQAKIDVLNELKKRSYRDSVYFPEIKYQHKYVHMDDIDEMIEELKK